MYIALEIPPELDVTFFVTHLIQTPTPKSKFCRWYLLELPVQFHIPSSQSLIDPRRPALACTSFHDPPPLHFRFTRPAPESGFGTISRRTTPDDQLDGRCVVGGPKMYMLVNSVGCGSALGVRDLHFWVSKSRPQHSLDANRVGCSVIRATKSIHPWAARSFESQRPNRTPHEPLGAPWQTLLRPGESRGLMLS